MARHRTHGIAFKRQVVQEYLAGETLHGLARRQLVAERHEIGAVIENDAIGETLLARFGQGPQPGEMSGRRRCGRLDLNHRDRPVVAFQHAAGDSSSRASSG